MPDHELDVQTCLTTAIPRYAEHLGDLVGEFIDYKNKTPPNSEQPTDLPRGVGVDVLAVIGARRVLALEAKKVDHNKRRLGKVEKNQVEFLNRLEKSAMFESYIVFDRLPDLHFDAVKSHPARRLAQLNAIAAVRPDLIEEAEERIGDFIGPKANGLTMLDVITRVVFEQPEAPPPDMVALYELLAENISGINNCTLWFFGDGFVINLTVDQARAALAEFAQMMNSAELARLVTEYENLRSARKTGSDASTTAIQEAQESYRLAQQTYLLAVQSRVSAIPKGAQEDEEEEREMGSSPKPGPR